MLVVFRPNGAYADKEDSFPPGTSKKTMQEATAERYGGDAKAYAVRETAEPTPWFCRLFNNEIITDPVKVAAALDAETAAKAIVDRRLVLRQKLQARTASVKEICEYLTPE